MKELKVALDASNPTEWNNVRSAVLRDILNKSMTPNAVNEAGDAIFSAARFNKAMKGMELKNSFLFTKAERKDLRQLGRVGNLVNRKIPGTVNYSNSSSAVFNMLRGTTNLLASTKLGPVGAVARAVTKNMDGLVNQENINKALDPLVALSEDNAKSRAGSAMERAVSARAGTASTAEGSRLPDQRRKSALRMKRDGQPFKTKKLAELAARSRKKNKEFSDFKIVKKGTGFAIRPR